jgi:hypothetical protein
MAKLRIVFVRLVFGFDGTDNDGDQGAAFAYAVLWKTQALANSKWASNIQNTPPVTHAVEPDRWSKLLSIDRSSAQSEVWDTPGGPGSIEHPAGGSQLSPPTLGIMFVTFAGFDQFCVISCISIGVRSSEGCNRIIHHLALAHVACDRGRFAGSGMRAC